MPSIKDDIKKITSQVVELNKEAKEAAQSTKSIGNNLKFDSNNIELIQGRFASLRNELEINNKKLAEMQQAQFDLEWMKRDKPYKNDEKALIAINKQIEDYRVKIQYAIDKQKELAKATEETAEQQALVKAVTEQVNERFAETEQMAERISRATVKLIAMLSKVVTSSVDTARDVYAMSRSFNSSAEDVQIWNKALYLATGTQDIFNDSMKTMIQGMSQISAGRGIAYNNVLKDIGVNYAQIASLDPTEQFEKMVEGLAGVENYSMRASYAQQLFGEKGVLLAGALDGGAESIERFKEQAKEFGIISDENTQRLVETGIELEKAKSQLGVAGAELTISLVPAIEILTELLKVANPIITSIASGIKATGGAGAGLTLALLGLAIVLPKIIAYLKTIRTQSILASVAIGDVAKATQLAKVGMGGWIGVIVGVVGALGLIIGAISSAKKQNDELNKSLNDTVNEVQGIMGGNAKDFTTTTETMATKATTYDMTINATIHGEGDTPISDENAVLTAQYVADEINKGFGDLIK